uniref:Ig-like domain-containing protein n=1 Tax=Electrophorus electricus TaxID=8005 RepID=A0A4W4DMY7_ELEEL
MFKPKLKFVTLKTFTVANNLWIISVCLKTSDISELQMKTVKHGDNITIKCDLNMAEENKNNHLAWYKQNFGKLPENIVRSFGDTKKYRFDPAFNSGRFSINVDGVFDLSINEIKEDDVGTYLCGKISTSIIEFVSGALLMFEENNHWIVIALAASTIILAIMVVLFGILFKNQMKAHILFQAEHSTILNYAAVRFTQKPSSSTTCRVKDSQDVYAQIKVS